MEAFTFETAEEVFSNGVVIGIALAGHALCNAEVDETQAVGAGRILDAAIGVEDEAGVGMAAADGRIESGEGEIRIDAVGESIADDLPGTQIFDSSETEPALIGRYAGDIADPSLVGSVKRKLAHEQIGSDRMRMLGVGGRLVSAFTHRKDVQLVHEAVDALARAGKVFADQVVQAVQAEGRILHTQRQKPAFQRLIVQLAHRGFAMRPFAVPAAGDFE